LIKAIAEMTKGKGKPSHSGKKHEMEIPEKSCAEEVK
jgi:hypothetical protein